MEGENGTRVTLRLKGLYLIVSYWTGPIEGRYECSAYDPHFSKYLAVLSAATAEGSSNRRGLL
ncbi:MAG: hypothetical protein EON58_01995 [Alphaproteobacteria bacterium]|nr:MAG: hypothetical protein EON58_01995 [Alphaproteobacteria bacterium]